MTNGNRESISVIFIFACLLNEKQPSKERICSPWSDCLLFHSIPHFGRVCTQRSKQVINNVLLCENMAVLLRKGRNIFPSGIEPHWKESITKMKELLPLERYPFILNNDLTFHTENS